ETVVPSLCPSGHRWISEAQTRLQDYESHVEKVSHQDLQRCGHKKVDLG
ncbi:mCG1041394, partial [Mus musculus]